MFWNPVLHGLSDGVWEMHLLWWTL